MPPGQRLRCSAMTGQEIVIVMAVMTIGAMVHGSTGIGLGLIAGPVLLSIEPDYVPGPLMLSTLVVGCRHLLAERQNIDRAILGRLVLGMPIGVVLAIVLLIRLDERTMALGIGALVVLVVGALLAGIELPRTSRYEVVGGAASSFGAVAAAVPGPQLVMTLHDLPGPSMRPTIAATTTITGLATAGSLALVGRFGVEELLLLAGLVPPILVGLLLARYVRPWLDRAIFRPVILLIALAGGLALIIRNI